MLYPIDLLCSLLAILFSHRDRMSSKTRTLPVRLMPVNAQQYVYPQAMVVVAIVPIYCINIYNSPYIVSDSGESTIVYNDPHIDVLFFRCRADNLHTYIGRTVNCVQASSHLTQASIEMWLAYVPMVPHRKQPTSSPGGF